MAAAGASEAASGSPGAGAAEFAYGREALLVGGVGWGGGSRATAFDLALERGWSEREARGGLFRYRLGEVATRVLPGPAGLVAQLNPQRARERRAPQAMRALGQPFDPAAFHFGRLRPAEVLFALAPSHRRAARVLVAINASPLERCHVLLVPEPARGLPQALTAEALLAGLEALLLSGRPDLRLGFNSPGAGASVNHLHLHAYYLARPLSLEHAPARPLRPRAGLYLLDGHAVPAPGLLLYDDGRRPARLARRAARLAAHLVRRRVAHNLFATRGAPPAGPGPDPDARPGLRLLLWPRQAAFGAKPQGEFTVALCELAGHLPLAQPRHFHELTEDDALRRIRHCLLPPDQLHSLQQELANLLDHEPDGGSDED